MKRLGHDDLSEILTVIKRMQEGSFVIDKVDGDSIYFTIKLVNHMSVPISHTSRYESSYIITNDYYAFSFEQLKGDGVRVINYVDGYIIWSLLCEKIN